MEQTALLLFCQGDAEFVDAVSKGYVSASGAPEYAAQLALISARIYITHCTVIFVKINCACHTINNYSERLST